MVLLEFVYNNNLPGLWYSSGQARPYASDLQGMLATRRGAGLPARILTQTRSIFITLNTKESIFLLYQGSVYGFGEISFLGVLLLSFLEVVFFFEAFAN